VEGNSHARRIINMPLKEVAKMNKTINEEEMETVALLLTKERVFLKGRP
jgi:hypothetical protein